MQAAQERGARSAPAPCARRVERRHRRRAAARIGRAPASPAPHRERAVRRRRGARRRRRRAGAARRRRAARIALEQHARAARAGSRRRRRRRPPSGSRCTARSTAARGELARASRSAMPSAVEVGEGARARRFQSCSEPLRRHLERRARRSAPPVARGRGPTVGRGSLTAGSRTTRSRSACRRPGRGRRAARPARLRFGFTWKVSRQPPVTGFFTTCWSSSSAASAPEAMRDDAAQHRDRRECASSFLPAKSTTKR